MKHVFIFLLLSMCLHVHGVSGVDTEEVSVKEEDSLTLNTGVKMYQEDITIWYFNDILIALITRDQSKICLDFQCIEIFRGRLKLDHQTGSLTIMDTRITDSGEYRLKIISSSDSHKIFRVSVYDSSLTPDVTVIYVVVLLIIAGVAGLIYCYSRETRKRQAID